jgi:uncharacterized protein Yka (UPF0111/DUF47 family)
LPDLRSEREASGEDDSTLDDVVSACRAGVDQMLFIPQASRIHGNLLGSVEQMLAPLRVSADASQPVEVFEQRFARLREHLPRVVEEAVPPGYVQAITRTERNGQDSLHLLVMDLHKELNCIQRSLAERVVDGASVYGLPEDDEPLLRAFMRGVNATAPLKFDHPGLGTTATRAGDQVIIQNDIGTTDAHVLVIHVTGLELSFIYTDVHRTRLQFLKGLFDGRGLTWSDQGASGAGYETCVGRRACSDLDELHRLLEFLGSRLVFLIDWNRARKRLSRFAKKSDAIAALRWAAELEYGHRAFLEAGGERLIYNALERTAAPQLRYGARLDEVLGQQPALAFIKAVLRITSEGLQQRRSLRLVRDEVQAELLTHLHDSQQSVLALAVDHASLIVALAGAMQTALLRVRGRSRRDLSSVAERAKRWESRADDIVSRARQAQRRVPDGVAVAQLLSNADDVADGIEEAIFLMTLLRDLDPAREAVDALDPLVRLTIVGAREYVKCLELARDVRRNGTHDDVQNFLIAVDRIITLEHESDEAERRAEAAMLGAGDSFRLLHVLSQIAHTLEESVDALARCALTLKDSVMSELLVE